MSTTTTTTAPIFVDVKAAAAALSLSVSYLRRDRVKAQRIPFLKLSNGTVRYDLNRCREAIAALEMGGTDPAAKAKR